MKYVLFNVLMALLIALFAFRSAWLFVAAYELSRLGPMPYPNALAEMAAHSWLHLIDITVLLALIGITALVFALRRRRVLP